MTLSRISSAHAAALREFFDAFAADAEARALFHPHPFTVEQAETIAHYPGRDFYAALLVDDRMAAYGMLRGWDEGYAIPSLGVAVGTAHRGLGLGRVMMDFLHAVARLRGAPSIMLKVYKTNQAAVHLYRQMGYELTDLNDREWKGSFRF